MRITEAGLKALGLGILFISSLFSLTGLWGHSSWLFDLTSHFPLQYLVIQAIALGLICKRRSGRWRLASLALILPIAFNAYRVGSYYWPDAQKPMLPKQSPRVKILQVNVLVSNQNYKSVSRLLRETPADVISLQEITRPWFRHLQQTGVFSRFPYQVVHLESGTLLASRKPLKDSRIILIPNNRPGDFLHQGKGSILLSTLQLGSRPVSLIALHPPIPLTSFHATQYTRYLQALQTAQPSLKPDKILIGDLNTTPWSENYRKYRRILNLQDMRAHQGFNPTWNVYLPIFLIPIDHILASTTFVSVEQKLGPLTGSDHLPVYLELGLKN